MIGGGDTIREMAGLGCSRNRLNLGETALRIVDFVNARTKTTSDDIVEKFAVDRKSASQYLRRLWLGGFIGKRARGLFEPAKSSPTPCEHSEDTDDSEHTEDFVDGVGSDEVEDTERVEDSDGTEDDNPDGIGESDDIEDTVDTAPSGDSDDTEQSEDRDDTGDSGDREDASAPAELTSGSYSVAARKGNPKVCVAGSCPDCGSELGADTGKCLKCILERARIRADQAGDSVVTNRTGACW